MNLRTGFAFVCVWYVPPDAIDVVPMRTAVCVPPMLTVTVASALPDGAEASLIWNEASRPLTDLMPRPVGLCITAPFWVSRMTCPELILNVSDAASPSESVAV